MSHDFIDCEEFIQFSNTTPVNSQQHLRFLSNGVTTLQMYSAIGVLLNTFELDSYAIIHGNNLQARSSLVKKIAESLAYKISFGNISSELKFMTSFEDSNLQTLIEKYKTNVKGN